MEKKCKVVMLTTNEKAHLWFTGGASILMYAKTPVNSPSAQHLYILSDDEIKEGDWVFNTLHTNECIHQIEPNKTSVEYHTERKQYNKIIATTNNTLHVITENADGLGNDLHQPIPSIPQSFIDRYVSEYNKGNKIEEVMVEYEQVNQNDPMEYEHPIPKLNPDNTINIKTIKDSWTREEVIELMSKSFDRGVKRELFDQTFIETNL